MIFIALIHGPHAVKKQGRELLVILRYDEFFSGLAAQERIPAAVGLQVVLVHDIDPVPVAELVQGALVGIVGGADGVDVVALHGQNIQKQLVPVRHPPAYRAEVVAVHAVEDQAFSVQKENAVLDLNPAEADLLTDDFRDGTRRVQDLKHDLIKVRRCGRPEKRMIKTEGAGAFLRGLGNGGLGGGKLLPVMQQAHAQAAAAAGGGGELQLAGSEVVVQQRKHGEVRDGGLRDHIQENAAEDTGEAIEVLILEPAAGRPFPDPDGQAVFPVAERVGQTEIGGREAVLAVADVHSVQPESKAALHALQRDADLLAAEMLRQAEGADIVGDRVKNLRHLAGLEFFLGIPGILGVHVGRNVIPFHLDMGGDPDAVPAGEVTVRLPEAVRGGRGIAGIAETPDAVQGHAQPALARGELRGVSIGDKVRVGGQAPVGEHGGVFHDGFIVKCFHKSSFKKARPGGGPDFTDSGELISPRR